jgi:lysophospholipase L1-like esterase
VTSPVLPQLHRFLALGDSFTEGMSDDGPAGQPRGWADRLAATLTLRAAGLEYANLAVRGKLLAQVRTEQVDGLDALVAEPERTLVSFHAGPNDVLRPGSDPSAIGVEYAGVVRALTARDVHVLLFTVIPRAGGSGRTAHALAQRFARFNDAVREVVADTGATLVDLSAVPAIQDRRFWNDDRLHLNALGHRRVAAAALAALGEQDPMLLGGQVGWWRRTLPPAPPRSRTTDLRDDLDWSRRHLAPWVWRRVRGVSSGDGRTAKRPEPSPVSSAPI